MCCQKWTGSNTSAVFWHLSATDSIQVLAVCAAAALLSDQTHIDFSCTLLSFWHPFAVLPVLHPWISARGCMVNWSWSHLWDLMFCGSTCSIFKIWSLSISLKTLYLCIFFLCCQLFICYNWISLVHKYLLSKVKYHIWHFNYYTCSSMVLLKCHKHVFLFIWTIPVWKNTADFGGLSKSYQVKL